MMGYALRDGLARGERDPLFARALYLRDLARGDPGVLFVVLDVCLLAVSQAAQVRVRLAERTGLPAGRILVCCTHTHAGPETGLAAAHERRDPPPHVAGLFEAAVRAGAAAVESAGPARLGVGGAEARIGRNRARDGAPIDPQILIVRVDRAGGSPLAVLFVHGCHPTALGHEQLEYSADWPGAAAREIESTLPGVISLFALGAHGDVDPRTRGLQDVAKEGRSLGVTPAEMEALGREVGAAAAAAALRIETSAEAPVGAASASVRLEVPGGGLGAEARARWLERRRAEAMEALGLPASEDPPLRDLFRLAHERSRGLEPRAARDRIGQVRLFLRDRMASYYASGLSAEVELQVLRLGDALLLAIPFEASAEVGLDWRARALAAGAPAGIGAAAVVSLANGWLRYLPHTAQFAGPDAHHRYDVLTSTFDERAGELLLAAGAGLARQLASWATSKPRGGTS